MARSEPRILSVSQLTGLVKELLETTLVDLWVSGEISDFSHSSAGHIYFCLKDDQAQIRCVIWRSSVARMRFNLQDGLAVICHGEISVYAPRGQYQFVVRTVEPRGEGAKQLALRQLHRRLAEEGLFDARHKKLLPRFPRRIALVTSPTGAAVRDFLEVLRRRWRGIHVLVIPTRVQGEEASLEIVRALDTANRLLPAADVIVVARGGGSLEDLWSFNDERLVRAIFASRVPVVSAVGHEIDVTLCDLVADLRALTPSEAAERVVPAEDEVRATLTHLRRRMTAGVNRRANEFRFRLNSLAQHRVFRRPLAHIEDLMRYVDELQQRATRGVHQAADRSGQRFHALAGKLESLSPLAVLNRGYSVTSRLRDGSIVRSAREVSPGEQILSQLSAGRVISRVESTDGEGPASCTREESRREP